MRRLNLRKKSMTILPKGNYVVLLEWISIDFREKGCLRGCVLNVPLVLVRLNQRIAVVCISR